MKLSLFRAKNEKKIQKPEKWHSAFTIFLPEDAIFSCWDFGKPKKSTMGATKSVRKNSFLKGKKCPNKIFVQKGRPLMAKRKIFLSIYIISSAFPILALLVRFRKAKCV